MKNTVNLAVSILSLYNVCYCISVNHYISCAVFGNSNHNRCLALGVAPGCGGKWRPAQDKRKTPWPQLISTYLSAERTTDNQSGLNFMNSRYAGFWFNQLPIAFKHWSWWRNTLGKVIHVIPTLGISWNVMQSIPYLLGPGVSMAGLLLHVLHQLFGTAHCSRFSWDRWRIFVHRPNEIQTGRHITVRGQTLLLNQCL